MTDRCRHRPGGPRLGDRRRSAAPRRDRTACVRGRRLRVGQPRLGTVPSRGRRDSIHVIAEVTLALVLFADAARVNLHDFARPAIPVRLLGIGLPLSVVLGGLVAGWMFDGFPWALAGFVGAALAPTDAALSVQVINDERIPVRIRRALNVESGLNDGIATPIVAFMLAVAASQLGVVDESVSFEAGSRARDLGWGLLVGVVAGIGGALLISIAARRGWIAHGGRRLATLAVAIAAFAVTLAFEVNGFIAAFVAGVAFAAMVDRRTSTSRRRSSSRRSGASSWRWWSGSCSAHAGPDRVDDLDGGRSRHVRA